jgi:glycerophosphoryl diester phosphodiesterase
MAARLPSLRRPPIGFADGGASAHEAPSSLESFVLARKLGATGLSSRLWRTADGRAVLSDTGSVGGRLRRRPLATVPAADAGAVGLPELYERCGSDVELAVEVGDADAVPEAIAVARGAGTEEKLWLVHSDPAVLAEWRVLTPVAKLVHSARFRRVEHAPERWIADLAAAQVDAVQLPHSDWTGGLVALAHRFEVFGLATGAQFDRTLAAVLDLGIDGVAGPDPEVMMAAIAALG